MTIRATPQEKGLEGRKIGKKVSSLVTFESYLGTIVRRVDTTVTRLEETGKRPSKRKHFVASPPNTPPTHPPPPPPKRGCGILKGQG